MMGIVEPEEHCPRCFPCKAFHDAAQQNWREASNTERAGKVALWSIEGLLGWFFGSMIGENVWTVKKTWVNCQTNVYCCKPHCCPVPEHLKIQNPTDTCLKTGVEH